jgi:hypothetical protein
MFYENEGIEKKSYLFLNGTDLSTSKNKEVFSDGGKNHFCFIDKMKKIFA